MENFISSAVQILLVIFICRLLFVFYKEKTFLEFIGIRNFHFNLSHCILTIISGFFCALFFYLISALFFDEIIDNEKFSQIGLLNGIIKFVLQTSLSEEILFRGAILNSLKKYFKFSRANLIQSCCFALLHIPAYINKGFIFCCFGVIFTFCSSYWMVILNKKYGNNSIFYSFLFHSSVNIFARI